jgi:hypothetical protein
MPGGCLAIRTPSLKIKTARLSQTTASLFPRYPATRMCRPSSRQEAPPPGRVPAPLPPLSTAWPFCGALPRPGAETRFAPPQIATTASEKNAP